MDAQDKVIVCIDCGAEFTHSVDDQARYAERGFDEPKRCRPCRDKRKAKQEAQKSAGGGGPRDRGPRPEGGGGRGPRPGGGGPRRDFGGPPRPRASFETTCAACGVQTTVPFEPVEGRPVYCRDCYRARKK